MNSIHRSVARFPKWTALILGLVSATGFAPLDLWPVTLFACAGLIWITSKADTQRSALARGYWFGVGHFTVGLNWIAWSFQYQETMPVWLGWIAVVLLSFYLSIYPAMATGFGWRFGKRHPILLVVFFVSGWIISEWLRATLFTGFAWNPMGAAMLPMGLAGGTTLFGTYGLSGLFMLIAGAIHLVSLKQWKIGLALAIYIPALCLMHSPSVFYSKIISPVKLITVVQPNIGQQQKYLPDYEGENFKRHARQTVQLLGESRLILWPEAAVPYRVGDDPVANARLASLLGPQDILVTGADKYFTKRTEKNVGFEEVVVGAANSAFAINAAGETLWRYDKAHLVPYGEYLALRWFLEPLGATRLVPGAVDFQPGPGPRSLDIPGFGKMGMQICYEIIFSGKVVDRTNRPDFVFNPSNDAWFGGWGSPQFLAQSRLRAIEEGLPVIRSTPTGISAVIDAQGIVRNTIPQGREGHITTALPPPGAPTLFAQYGNILPLGFAFILFLLGIALSRRLG
jgi:apolipoprotein N-acyltransferase